MSIWLMPLPAIQRGFIIGVLLTALVVLVLVVIVVGSGQLPRVWGMGGEQATSDVFNARRRKRQGWSILHGVRLNTEIDHVAVGPGGVLAIESKWASADPWRLVENRIIGPHRDPIAQARRAGRNLTALLGSPRCGRLHIDAIPVVVIWGPGSPDIEEGYACIDGVWVFNGAGARSRIGSMSRGSTDRRWTRCDVR